MDTITVQTVAAARVQQAADSLIQAVTSTPEDKLHWKPMDSGRPVLNQAVECVFANMKWAATIRNRAFTTIPAEVEKAIKESFRTEIEAGCWSGETVKSKLREVTLELAEAILAVSDSELTLPIATPPPYPQSYLLVDCFNHPYWNMVYLLGQINYIQTLLGDNQNHF